MKRVIKLTETELVKMLKTILSESNEVNDDKVKEEMEKKFPCLAWDLQKTYFRDKDGRMVAFEDGDVEKIYYYYNGEDGEYGEYENKQTGQKSKFRCSSNGSNILSDMWYKNKVLTEKSPLNVRKGPSVRYPVIGKLNPKQVIYVRCEDMNTGQLYSHKFCQYTSDPTKPNHMGWVYGKYIWTPWDFS